MFFTVLYYDLYYIIVYVILCGSYKEQRSCSANHVLCVLFSSAGFDTNGLRNVENTFSFVYTRSLLLFYIRRQDTRERERARR